MNDVLNDLNFYSTCPQMFDFFDTNSDYSYYLKYKKFK
jgi:hypothetical protein